MHKDKLLNVISSLVAIVKKQISVSWLRGAAPSTGSLIRLARKDKRLLWHTRSSLTSARALLTVLMLVQLPASNQEVEQIKKVQIFIGLISIPVLTAAFVCRYVLWLTPSFLRSAATYKSLADINYWKMTRSQISP